MANFLEKMIFVIVSQRYCGSAYVIVRSGGRERGSLRNGLLATRALKSDAMLGAFMT